MIYLFEELKRIVVQRKTFCLTIVFGLYLVIGLSIFSDYGVSWDEIGQDSYGFRNLEFVLHGKPFPENRDSVYYGPVFSTAAYVIGILLPLPDERSRFLTNHFLVLLYFYLSVLCFFQLARGYFKSDFWSLLATVFLVISPRIFADSFYNPKDIPFLSSMIIGFFSMQKFLRKPAISSGIWHGLASAIAIDIRILGLMLPAVTFILNLLDKRVRDKNSKYLKRLAVAWSAYLLICGIFVVILWPFLWGDPIGRFVEAFNLMRKFAWDGATLYLGQYVSGKAVPWHYAPVWITITTPISLLLLFVIGLAKLPWILKRVLKSDDIPGPFILAPYLWFFMPLICVIFLKSTLYDGWRQLYFIYPGLVIIATLGLKDLWTFVSRISFKPVRNAVFVIILSDGPKVWDS